MLVRLKICQEVYKMLDLRQPLLTKVMELEGCSETSAMMLMGCHMSTGGLGVVRERPANT